ncbi:MAG: hypothetical protein MPEBLZ_01385 [Candidatus Methanoperedens nitroreducens]|uniref:Uncharacterized protein n=1 Tax=Candidatus Methanoperedens nitratireducens TaxID=1392998 RepID=A0A0P8AHX4_9EURY|nr:MAG: hypothetical protein MPEBLZ_01385 [Candidatus Methanoperedens sp. BLZ1]
MCTFSSSGKLSNPLLPNQQPERRCRQNHNRSQSIRRTFSMSEKGCYSSTWNSQPFYRHTSSSEYIQLPKRNISAYSLPFPGPQPSHQSVNLNLLFFSYHLVFNAHPLLFRSFEKLFCWMIYPALFRSTAMS